VDDRRPRVGVAATSRTDRLARNVAEGFKSSFIIALVVVWNALFILGGFLPGKPPPEEPGLLVPLALAVVLVASFAVDRSPAFQRWVLKPGRSVGEIRPALRLIQLTTGLLLVIFAIVFRVA